MHEKVAAFFLDISPIKGIAIVGGIVAMPVRKEYSFFFSKKFFGEFSQKWVFIFLGGFDNWFVKIKYPTSKVTYFISVLFFKSISLNDSVFLIK